MNRSKPPLVDRALVVAELADAKQQRDTAQQQLNQAQALAQQAQASAQQAQAMIFTTNGAIQQCEALLKKMDEVKKAPSEHAP